MMGMMPASSGPAPIVDRLDASVTSTGNVTTIETALSTVGDGDCILRCWDEPSYCEEGEHDAWWVQNGQNEYGGGYHSQSNPCWEGDCTTHHPACGGGALTSLPADLEDLQRGILEVNVELVVESMRAMGPRWVEFVPERSALQVFGCDATVVAHLPVGEEIQEALAVD
jgi:hypothetical protein